MFHRPKSEELEATPQKTEKKSSVAVQPPQQESFPGKHQESFLGKKEKEYVAAPPEQKSVAHVAKPITPVEQAEEDTHMITERPETQSREDRPTDTQAAGHPFPQRVTQPVQRPIPGGFGAAPYSGAAMQSSNAPYEMVRSEDRRLVIGQGITMSGEIEACDYLLVEGTLEAALKGAKVLEIAESGTFYGSVEIEEATIAGRFEGELTVNGRITVKSGGSITGSISYKELAVEAGALVDGKLSPLASSGAHASQTKAKVGAKNDNRGHGSELPFAGNSALAAE